MWASSIIFPLQRGEWVRGWGGWGVGRGGGAENQTKERKGWLCGQVSPFTESTLSFFFISWDFIFPGEKFPSSASAAEEYHREGKSLKKHDFIVKMTIHRSKTIQVSIGSCCRAVRVRI